MPRFPRPLLRLRPQVSNAIKFSPRGRELRVLLEFSELQLDAPAMDALESGAAAAAGGGADALGGGGGGGSDPSAGTGTASAAAAAAAAAAASAAAAQSVGSVLMRVTVRDEGAGIPLEHQANLFKVR